MKTLFLSVGDASGDQHCSLLVRELRARHPDWNIVALAGPLCEAGGARLLGSTRGLGVIGFASALAVLPRSWWLHKRMLRFLASTTPDAAILCDWGGFNTRVLPDFKRQNVPVLYYFPPRSWQKEGDAGTQIAPLVDAVATPFEWSAQKLQRAGANAQWVGHPILENIAALPLREELRAKFGFSSKETVVVLLPGSRAMEIACITPHLAKALPLISSGAPTRTLRFVVAASRATGEQLKKFFPSSVSVVEGQTLELLRAADIGLVKSGTSTLEAAALDLPQIVVYEAPALIRLQVELTGLRRKIPFVAMPNIILNRGAVPELLGEKCRAPLIAREALALLDSTERVARMKEDYALVRRALGEQLSQSATKATADLVESLLVN